MTPRDHLAQNALKAKLCRRLLGELFTKEDRPIMRDAIMVPLRKLELELAERLKDKK